MLLYARADMLFKWRVPGQPVAILQRLDLLQNHGYGAQQSVWRVNHLGGVDVQTLKLVFDQAAVAVGHI